MYIYNTHRESSVGEPKLGFQRVSEPVQTPKTQHLQVAMRSKQKGFGLGIWDFGFVASGFGTQVLKVRI